MENILSHFFFLFFPFIWKHSNPLCLCIRRKKILTFSSEIPAENTTQSPFTIYAFSKTSRCDIIAFSVPCVGRNIDRTRQQATLPFITVEKVNYLMLHNEIEIKKTTKENRSGKAKCTNDSPARQCSSTIYHTRPNDPAVGLIINVRRLVEKKLYFVRMAFREYVEKTNYRIEIEWNSGFMIANTRCILCNKKGDIGLLWRDHDEPRECGVDSELDFRFIFDSIFREMHSERNGESSLILHLWPHEGRWAGQEDTGLEPNCHVSVLVSWGSRLIVR